MSNRARRPGRRRLSRRAFLEGAGAAGAAALLSPFVPLLNASGDGEVAPKRLVLFFTPHGTVHDRWLPSGGETDFTLGEILSPLERHRDQIVVLDGLRMRASESVGAPHTKGPPLLWTGSPLREDRTFSRDDGMGVYYYGWNSGPSVDQVIADRIGAELPYRSIEAGLASGGNHPGHRMIYRGAEQPVSPEPSPHALFSRVFGAGAPGAENERRMAERRSVLDSLTADLGRMRARVARADRDKIDAHLESVRDIERGLSTTLECAIPDIGDPLDLLDRANVPEIFDRQFELITAALTCDLTRVASMQYAVGENDGMLYDFIGVSREVHHLITHERTAQAEEELTRIYSFYAEHFARFLDRLASVPEGDGTLLDNTMVVWGSELGRGYDHDFGNVPFVVAGGGAGGVRTGRFLSFSDTDHNRLLVAMCRYMGLSDIDRFGSLDEGPDGPLAGLLSG